MRGAPHTEDRTMKAITVLTAAAALAAGLSIANAQNNMAPGSSTSTKSLTNQLTNQVTGNDKFCIKGVGGALNCKFTSLPDCEKAAKSGESCQLKPNSTTGSGSMAK
jgi:hypothetical protein